jgi:hypothetical protein
MVLKMAMRMASIVVDFAWHAQTALMVTTMVMRRVLIVVVPVRPVAPIVLTVSTILMRQEWTVAVAVTLLALHATMVTATGMRGGSIVGAAVTPVPLAVMKSKMVMRRALIVVGQTALHVLWTARDRGCLLAAAVPHVELACRWEDIPSAHPLPMEGMHVPYLNPNIARTSRIVLPVLMVRKMGTRPASIVVASARHALTALTPPKMGMRKESIAVEVALFLVWIWVIQNRNLQVANGLVPADLQMVVSPCD